MCLDVEVEIVILFTQQCVRLCWVLWTVKMPQCCLRLTNQHTSWVVAITSTRDEL